MGTRPLMFCFFCCPPPPLFSPVRRRRRRLPTMFTAGVAVCHCRVRLGSEKVTTSDDVLCYDLVRRERAEHRAICALYLNSQDLIKLILKRERKKNATVNKQYLGDMLGRADESRNVSNLHYCYLYCLYLYSSDCCMHLSRAESIPAVAN